MSLIVVKAGLLDTIQDLGRFGYAQLGIRSGGAMDALAMRLANAAVANPMNTAVLEIHFPAPVLQFETDVLFALAGAGFDARCAGLEIPCNTPVLVRAGSTLSFHRPLSGARCYLAVGGGFGLTPWLGSCSTDLAAGAGGWQGRALQAGDRVPLNSAAKIPALLSGGLCRVMPWSARPDAWYAPSPIRFMPGPEYGNLIIDAKRLLETAAWPITPKSDRMGYRTSGPTLEVEAPAALVSTAVVPGTLQLLPDGQFIVLMADCQTTGGYPRIGQVISADMPRLAQLRPGERFRLEQVELATAFDASDRQEGWLKRVAAGFYFNLNNCFM